jgi:hypothetical protein
MAKLSHGVARRQSVERRVIRAFVRQALRAGHWLRVHNGECFECVRTDRESVVMAALMTTDEDHIFVYAHEHAAGRSGWVFLVYGNDGWDVINDYTLSIESLMSDADALADRLEGCP